MAGVFENRVPKETSQDIGKIFISSFLGYIASRRIIHFTIYIHNDKSRPGLYRFRRLDDDPLRITGILKIIEYIALNKKDLCTGFCSALAQFGDHLLIRDRGYYLANNHVIQGVQVIRFKIQGFSLIIFNRETNLWFPDVTHIFHDEITVLICKG